MLGLHLRPGAEKGGHDFMRFEDISEMYLFIVQNNDGDPLAVHIVVRHGLASIPLVSWRSKKGQKLYAPNYILWNIILAMKDLGVQWFDHGGIDDLGTPEVAQFKRGLKGEEYILVGEWIAY